MYNTWHPIVNLIYFIFVIAFTIVLMNPICIIISLLIAFANCVLLKGIKYVLRNMLLLLPLFLITILINPLFCHEGMTIINYFPDGNPLTLESIYYGVAMATMFITVILWFMCINEVFTSDKIMYLFGRILPTFSILLTMTLRFVPRLVKHIKEVEKARKNILQIKYKNNIIGNIKKALEILSITITWAMDDAIDTADSMKSRAYGIGKRTSYSIYDFDKRNRRCLLIMIFMIALIIYNISKGALNFYYYPTVKGNCSDIYSVITLLVYTILCALPIFYYTIDKIKLSKSINSMNIPYGEEYVKRV
ncbi:MAG: energy-coupling factor transporter transmembrane component T [Eubacterium sp.]